VNPDQVAGILALAPERVLFARQVLTRFYPERGLAAQVLGVVGRSGRGLDGLELELDRFLRGMTWRFVQQRDLKGRALSSPQRPTLAGGTVTLTLDRSIQQAAEEALDAIMLASEPESASLVVQDVRTGELLAVASRPTTNLNDPYRREIETLKDRSARDAHEPGSVMKPFVVALAIDQGVATPETLIDCENGRWRVGGTPIRDDHPHGVISLTEVIKFSSNIGSAKLALQLGAADVIATLKRFGFASRTEAGLPNERSGFLRDPEIIKPIELATTAYGQGMTATTLQLVGAVATLGNGGVRMQPYLVSQVKDAWGEVLVSRSPEELGRVVSAVAADQVLAMMATVLEDGGTGTRARIPGFSAAGKTGTAWKVVDGQYSKSARVSSFIGVTPASEPRIAIAVLVDTPHKGSRYGGTVAGPAFSHVGLRALQQLGVTSDIPPEIEEVEPVESPDVLFPVLSQPALAWADDGAYRLPNFAGDSLRDVLVAVDGAGLEIALVGTGFAISQTPAAGQLVSVGDRVEIRFQ
jgi:cell division protein FtsI (penicillin-binding protein 3)